MEFPKFPECELNGIVCPGCGMEMDMHMATQLGAPAPRDGDVGICAECATLCKYVVVDGTIGVRRLTDDELDIVLKRPETQNTIKALKIAREQVTGVTHGERPDLEWNTLPCGCQWGVSEVDQAFAFQPCSRACPNFQYAMTRFGDGGNPIEIRHVP